MSNRVRWVSARLTFDGGGTLGRWVRGQTACKAEGVGVRGDDGGGSDEGEDGGDLHCDQRGV